MPEKEIWSVRFGVRRWSAWAPGYADAASWEAWSRSPAVPDGDDAPAIPFVQASLRRRASKVARMMLWTIYGALDADDLGRLPSIFATEGGESETTLELLSELASEQLLSPMRFSLSVHNASAGLFSIAAKNREATTTISSGEQTLACGLLELSTQLAHGSDERLLFVSADERLPELLRNKYVAMPFHYSLAMDVAKQPVGCGITLRLVAGSAPQQDPLPQPFALIRFLLSTDTSLLLPSSTQTLVLQKDQPISFQPCFGVPAE